MDAEQPQGQNYMTLQLSLPAFERLLEVGGNDIIVKISNAVITESVQRRVRALIERGITAQVDTAIAGTVGTIDYRNTVTLKGEYKKTVAQEALNATNKLRDELTKLIETTIHDQLGSLRLDIAKKLETMITSAIKVEVNTLVKAKLREAMEAAG